MKFALSSYSPMVPSLRRITAVASGSLLLAALLPACGSDPPAEDGPAAGTTQIGDANSFQSTAMVTLPVVVTAASGTNVSVCWTVPEDLLCHAAPPVKTLFLLRLTEPDPLEVQRLIVSGTLDDYRDGTLRYKTADDVDGDGCATLAEFKNGDAPVTIDSEYYATTDYSYLLLFSSAEGVGLGTMSMSLLQPGAGTTPVASPTGCGQLAYSVELETLTPVTVPATGPWPIDWRGLTRTGDGNPEVPFADIDRAFLAFYPGRDLKNLEENIFDLEQLEGAKYWEIALAGDRDTDLSLAVEKGTGAAFPGFATAAAGATGTWMLALMCGSCPSPAPIMLTVLNPT